MEERQAEERVEELRQNSQVILECIRDNEPILNSLHIGSLDGGFVSTDGATVSKLGDCIGANTHLERLFYYNDLVALSDDIESRTLELASKVMACNEAFFDGLKRNGSVSVLGLHRCSLAEGTVGNRMLKAFRKNDGNLTHISLHGCPLGGKEIDLLASTLRRCTNVEDVSLTGSMICDGLLETVVAALRGLLKLKKLRLGCDHVRSVTPLATLIEDPACGLVTLDLGGRFVIGDDCADALASALRNNATLESINLPCHSRKPSIISDRGWDAISRAVCDTTSVDATYSSNHVLKFVGGRVPPIGPLKVSLRLNGGRDKRRVAVEKILLHHRRLDMRPFFGRDLRALPAVVGWFCRAKPCAGNKKELNIDARRLDAIYQFVRAMPESFEPAPRRVKAERGQDEKLPCAEKSLAWT